MDWQPDTLTFLVDNNVVRTIKASDCLNKTTGVTQYPNTPSRIQLRSDFTIFTGAGPNFPIVYGQLASHLKHKARSNGQEVTATLFPDDMELTVSQGLINWDDPDYVSAGMLVFCSPSISFMKRPPRPLLRAVPICFGPV